MPKSHFTSLLRPRGRYKSIEAQPESAAVVTATGNGSASSQQLTSVTPPPKHVEIIPTLDFTVGEPLTLFEAQHVAGIDNINLYTPSDQDIAAIGIGNSNDDEDDDDDDDNHSRHTYIIESASDTNTDALLQQEVNNLSLTDATASSSLLYEPTSSISIEMDNLGKSATSAATTTDEVAAAATATTTSRGNSNLSAMTSVTTPSSDPSIEEEIEEAIETSEEEALVGSGEVSALDLSEAPRSSKPIAREKQQPAHHQLFGIESSDEASEEQQHFYEESSATKRSSSDDEQFKIDDEQLSGGKLAQHFVLDDEGEDDDDDGNSGDLDFSFPLGMKAVHSRHSASRESDVELKHDAEVKERSLDSNQSTADDVSDFVEEPRQGDDSIGATSDNFNVPVAEETQKSNDQEQVEISLNETGTEVKEEEEEKSTAKSVHVQQEEMTNLVGAPLMGASPEHSEKDHSIEEIVESNQSIEMALDDKDLSSLNPSFDIHNESLVNRLLTDPLEPEQLLLEDKANTVECDNVEEINQQATNIASNKQNTVEKKEKITTDLDESIGDSKDVMKHVEKTDSKVENMNLLLHEAEIIENKNPSIWNTLLLQAEPEVEEEILVPLPEREGSDINFASDDSKALLRGESCLQRNVNTIEEETEDEDDTSMKLMKLRILAMKHQTKDAQVESPTEVASSVASVNNEQITKPMERVPLSEFSKDVLEDITEESERNSLSTAEEQRSLSIERLVSTVGKSGSKTLQREDDVEADTSTSIVSLNMLQTLEHKVTELQSMLASKDACLAALNLQLETAQRRESSGANSGEPLGSGRDTSSLVTNSTEYRTLQEDFGGPTMDIYMELSKRDELIAKLTDSLQQSMNVRENLQSESEKLTVEVQLLRKQLSEALETLRRPYWPRGDQESNGGQRISEISMDLISESDDELDRQFLTDNEDKYSRNSRERQLSVPRQMETLTCNPEIDMPEWSQTPFSKQIEQFQKYLTPSEVRLFFMVQKKFDDFLSSELEKCKMKCEHELKVSIDQLESEKQQKDEEIKKLLNMRQEKDNLHSKEMEDLRKYFETKCADLEKQFSDDVFSHKSQHQTVDTSSSEASDQEQMPEEVAPFTAVSRSKESSPRKRSRAELLLSPSHRQMTPCGDAFADDSKNINSKLALEIAELKAFYQNKIHELQRLHEEDLRKVSDKVKYYESRYPDDEYMDANTKHTENTREMLNNTASTVNTTTTTTNITTTSASQSSNTTQESVTQQVRDANTSLIIIDQDELNLHNESQVIQKIIEEYERRLQEQLTLAREDIVRELEQQIQTLLSETTTDDQHWPPELILLREKFTAKSQLQIAQLQIKHEEEMSRLKLEYEKQLNRKNKRHSTFDSARDFDQIISDRDNLRELSKTFRYVLAELAKCMVNCEDDLNTTLMDEVRRVLANNRTLEEQTPEAEMQLNLSVSVLNNSLGSNKQTRLVPDVHNLLELVEDPSLVEFISNKSGDLTEDFDLKECVERLNAEAVYLLQLSENMHKRQKRQLSISSGGEKNDSCCEETEEGFKSPSSEHVQKFLRTCSLNEQHLPTYEATKTTHTQLMNSLPPDLNRLQHEQYSNNNDDLSTPGGNASELNFQVHELKNRLVKSETDRLKLQQELEHTITRNTELGQELQVLRDQLSQLNSLNHTDFAEGYGNGSFKSPQRLSASDRSSTNFAQLQEKARNILSSPTQQQRSNDATVVLLQMIEDFCREGDKVVECNKKDREDLQAQIDAADKQLKATRNFLEEQATEREQERDEFLREIERLKALLRDKEKERSTFEHASKEVEQLDAQVRELSQKLKEANTKRDKLEEELKASIDKIFVLREIITELETQVETKALNEHVLGEKVRQLEDFMNAQSRSNETLQHEVQSLKQEIGESYQERIRFLEEKLQNMRPSAEQSMVLEQVVEQLRDIENTLDQKTKNLESLHHTISSNSNSVTEDVSVSGSRPISMQPTAANIAQDTLNAQGSPLHPSPRQHSLTMEGVQRIAEKLCKHTRVEEAAVKRIRDLEMQVTQMRNICVELQHERDSLQERMSEQTQRISALQSRLEEQRQRAEELQRAGTSDLNIRIHDLQTEVQNLRETLSVRDKQIAIMKQQLEKSKVAIDRLEAELAVEQQPDRSIVERLETELKQKNAEIQKLREKIKNEMINKLALPDLMETMLADKNEEIDHLKEQLESKEKELLEQNSSQASSLGVDGGKNVAGGKDEASTKLSARTLSDIVSITEFDEPDVVRRTIAVQHETPLLVPEGDGGFLQQTMETSKEAVANLTQKRTEDLSDFATLRPGNTFDHPHYFQDPHALHMIDKSGTTATPSIVPRQINFSEVTEDSKLKTPNMLQTPVEKRSDEDVVIIKKLEHEVLELKGKLESLENEKKNMIDGKDEEMRAMEEDLVATQVRLGGLQHELEKRQNEIQELKTENEKNVNLQEEVAKRTAEIEKLLDAQAQLTQENKEQKERLTKSEKNLLNYRENEEKYLKRIAELEEKILQTTANEVNERESLRKELKALGDIHEKCKDTVREVELRKLEIERLNKEIKAKDERLQMLTTKLVQADENVMSLQQQISQLEVEVERLRQQQQGGDNSSRQFSVDEIAKEVEKELNYSAQLDSNILKAIESEEENNLDRKRSDKDTKDAKTETQGTDDENFTGERDLLNQLEALKAQIAIEREQGEEIRKELLAEKQHSQVLQEQDVQIIEAMRKRLETALEQEDELHKQLDMERERCERVQTQLTAMQRAESRRNSLLLKSPSDSPRKSPRSIGSDFDSDVAERLRSEIKMLTAQNERERERCADLQRSTERERQRYDMELQERVEYCEKLKREMEKVAREKENAEQECDHLQERLTLQTQEIESLEARLATLQEAETRRSTRRERQQKESAQLLAELQELKSQLLATECERESLQKTITLLRCDIERAAQREAKLAEALANANANAANASDASVPQQFLQKMKEINELLAENTQENRQMAETVQFLVEERRQLQKKCEELEAQLGGTANVVELEERCNHLLGRYLRVESHRKALVYQKRYLKISLQSYQESEQRALAALNGGHILQPQKNKKKLFKTVALAIIAIQRIKYIGRIWHTGKRIVSKSVFTITQQKRTQTPIISCAAVSSTSPKSPPATSQFYYQSPYKRTERQLAPLQSPTLVNECANGGGGLVTITTATTPIFDWPCTPAYQQQ